MHIKANIGEEKANIGAIKANIDKVLENIDGAISNKTIKHIIMLHEECGKEKVFGRFTVEKVTGLKATRAYEIIKIMLDNDIIIPVKGYMKGKYRFS